MAAIAASDVTVAITEQLVSNGGWKDVYGTITFGNGSLTYSTAGIPLPAIGVFGMKANLEKLHVFGVNARTTDYVLQYNKSAHKLLLYEEEAAAAGGPLLEADTSEAPAARTYNFHAFGW